MHPNPSFRWEDEAAMRAFIANVAFAHIFASTPDGPMVAHAPLVAAEDGSLRFHVARGNRIARHLDGARLLLSVAADDFYVSPDWYTSADQVPTWNYIAVEVEGVARRLDEAELIAQLDALSLAHESRLAPKAPWTRAKMAEGRFEPMLKAIIGFALNVETMRGTRKLSQNKNEADRAGVVAGLEGIGRTRLGALVAEARA